jgi:selenophosphate synthetase-related protein
MGRGVPGDVAAGRSSRLVRGKMTFFQHLADIVNACSDRSGWFMGLLRSMALSRYTELKS